MNDVKPYAVSMVDTYGLLHPSHMLYIYDILEHNADQSIGIGFHAHNNLQLAYANAITFVDKSLDYAKQGSIRDIVVDGTLFGMGKSAGNAQIELLSTYLNDNLDKNYRLSPMLEAIEESVKEVYSYKPWDYKTMFYLSAKNKCHPSYVSFFESKGNLSVTKLDKLLGMIEPAEKKLLYDKELAEQLYKEYVSNCIDDIASAQILSDYIKDREVLILGPGKNIKLQSDKVKNYIENKTPVVIAINYIPKEYMPDYVFVSKLSRYKQMSDALHMAVSDNTNMRIIATSNVETIENDAIYFNREPLLEKREDIIDNSFLMLLKIPNKACVKKVSLAGLDGYSDREDNYFEPSMEYGFVKSVARHLNSHIHRVLFNDYAHIEFTFATYSHYMEEFDPETAGF